MGPVQKSSPCGPRSRFTFFSVAWGDDLPYCCYAPFELGILLRARRNALHQKLGAQIVSNLQGRDADRDKDVTSHDSD